MAGALVLAFPLIAAIGFGLVTYVDLVLLKGRGLLERFAQFFYLGFLVVPLAVVWVASAPQGGVPAMFRLPEGRPGWWVPLWLALGVVLGGVLYAGELWGTLVLRNLPGLGSVMRHPAVEGHTDTVRRQVQQVAAPVAFTLTAGGTVLLEEIVWRGFLIEYLAVDWGLGLGIALLLSGVSFGFNHLYFGLRGFVFKSVHGVAWGLLFVLSGVLWAAIVSHFAFNVWVWLKLRKGVAVDRVVTPSG